MKKVYNITNEAHVPDNNNIIWIILVLFVLTIIGFFLFFKKPFVIAPIRENVTNSTTNSVKDTNTKEIKEVIVTGIEKIMPTDEPIEATATPVL